MGQDGFWDSLMVTLILLFFVVGGIAIGLRLNYKPTRGGRREERYQNLTCDEGLRCLDNLCVQEKEDNNEN